MFVDGIKNKHGGDTGVGKMKFWIQIQRKKRIYCDNCEMNLVEKTNNKRFAPVLLTVAVFPSSDLYSPVGLALNTSSSRNRIIFIVSGVICFTSASLI